MRLLLTRAVACVLGLAAHHLSAAFPTVALKPVCTKQIHSPTNIVSAGDGSGRLFITDQPGVIYIFKDGMLLPTPFLNISSTAGGPVLPLTTSYSERGLLGLVFHPGYANPASPGYRKFYVNYTKTNAPGVDPAPPLPTDPVNCVTVIAEYEVSATDPNVANPASARRVLAFTQPQSNHNGGQLEFGPDGFLYIGSGDGGGSNDNGGGHTGSSVSPTSCLGNSQDRTRYLGKILRIDPLDPDGAGPATYSIPASNPFFNDPTPDLKKEIYAFGLRNPWRFAFDKRPGGTNRLFCADVGQLRIEEVNLIVAGGNYGWRYKEGLELPTFSSGAATDPMPHPGGTLIDPIAMYAHPGVTTTPPLPQLGLSGTGGYVYRGSAIPALQGKYVFGDYGSTSGASDGRIMGLEETSPGSGIFTLTQAIPILNSSNPVVGQRILCFGEDESGEIYIGMKTNSGVLQLDPPVTGLPAGGIYKIVPVQSGTVSLVPAKDNTIFSDNPPRAPITGYPSDGLGFLYAGRTGPNHGPFLRRGLLSFDFATQIPSGAVIRSASLKLRATKFGPSSLGTVIRLHRLSESWGEGTSVNSSGAGFGAQATVGDATWVRRFFDTSSWTTPGGTFSSTASASLTVNSVTPTFPSTSLLVSDVQGWVNNPANNAGWILLGNETVDETAIQFTSRDQGIVPPELTVDFEAVDPLPYREQWLNTHFLIGQFVDDLADLDGDNINNLLEYAWGFSPKVLNPQSQTNPGLRFTSVRSGANRIFTVFFRRDPRATDLTYELKSTSDFVTWTTLATSSNGDPASGDGVVNEQEIAAEAPIQVVEAQETLPANSRRFVKLVVTRGGSVSSFAP